MGPAPPHRRYRFRYLSPTPALSRESPSERMENAVTPPTMARRPWFWPRRLWRRGGWALWFAPTFWAVGVGVYPRHVFHDGSWTVGIPLLYLTVERRGAA
jgi:hypothetical protein